MFCSFHITLCVLYITVLLLLFLITFDDRRKNHNFVAQINYAAIKYLTSLVPSSSNVYYTQTMSTLKQCLHSNNVYTQTKSTLKQVIASSNGHLSLTLSQRDQFAHINVRIKHFFIFYAAARLRVGGISYVSRVWRHWTGILFKIYATFTLLTLMVAHVDDKRYNR